MVQCEMCFELQNTFFCLKEGKTIFKELMINSDIREKEVRLIDENGTMMGVMPTAKAMQIADGRNLDLVMISSQAVPAVCKIMDYRKYRFDQIKREKEDKKKQSQIELKDIWLSATIDIGDMKTKAKKVCEFIGDGNKVRLSIRMKGRQQAHPEISVGVMESFFELIKEVAVIEKKPLQEGRSITMVVAPINKKNNA